MVGCMVVLIMRFNDAAPNRAEERPDGTIFGHVLRGASMMPPPIGRKNRRRLVFTREEMGLQ